MQLAWCDKLHLAGSVSLALRSHERISKLPHLVQTFFGDSSSIRNSPASRMLALPSMEFVLFNEIVKCQCEIPTRVVTPLLFSLFVSQRRSVVKRTTPDDNKEEQDFC